MRAQRPVKTHVFKLRATRQQEMPVNQQGYLFLRETVTKEVCCELEQKTNICNPGISPTRFVG